MGSKPKYGSEFEPDDYALMDMEDNSLQFVSGENNENIQNTVVKKMK